MCRDITYVFYVFQPGGRGAIPEAWAGGMGMDVGMDVGMDMGMDMGRHINGGAKWPENHMGHGWWR